MVKANVSQLKYTFWIIHTEDRFPKLHDFSNSLCSASGSRYVLWECFLNYVKHNISWILITCWWTTCGCISVVTTEINVGISELVHKIDFLQYFPLIMTNWKVVSVEQKGLVGVLAAVKMLIFKWHRIFFWHYQIAPNRI